MYLRGLSKPASLVVIQYEHIVGDCVRGGSDSHGLSLYDCRRAAGTTGLVNFGGLVLAAMRESMLKY